MLAHLQTFKSLVITFLCLFIGHFSYAQVIFSETFGEGDDMTTGVDDIGAVSWSSTCPDCIDAGDYFKIKSGKLVGQDTNGPATWLSETIDISSCDFIEIELDLWEEGTMEACGTGCNSVDFVQLEYKIDGGAWTSPPDASFCSGACAGVLVIQSDDIPAGFLHYATGCIAGGATLQVRIIVQTWAADERWLVDNVTVSCAEGFLLDAGPDQTVCEGSAVILTADNPDGAVLDWNNDVVDGVSFVPVGSDEYIVTGELGSCTTSDTVNVTVVPMTDVVIVPAGPFTTGAGIYTMVASPPGGTWTATCGACIDPITGQFNPAVAGAGSWTICYAAGIAPCDDEECTTVIVTDAECIFDGTVSYNNPTCFGFSDGSVTFNTTGATGETTFIITNEAGVIINVDNSNTANSLSEGWYYFNVSDEFPCVLIDSVYLDDPEQLIINLDTFDPLCYGDYTGGATVVSIENPTGDPALISYVWSPNPNGTNGIGQDSLPDANAGEYNLSVTDENGCSAAIDFVLENPDSLYLVEFGYDPAFCRVYDYQNGNGVVFASASGGTPDYDYEWTNLETMETTENTTWGGLNPGNYQIRVVDQNGCVLMQTITVDSLNPIADFTLSSDQFTTPWEGTAPVDVHFVNTSSNFSNPNDPLADTSFFWNFGNGEAVLSTDYFETFDQTYLISGDYLVCLSVSNKNGCVDSICKLITVYDPFVFVPVNIFSPNDDGKNDVFSFEQFAQSVSEFSCIIMNRWGVQVFELNSISTGWDGLLKNGNLAPTGVYFYIYQGKTDNGSSFEGHGTVELVR